MQERADSPWMLLAREIEARCHDLNDSLKGEGRRLIPFDIDLCRRIVLMLEEARSPLPSLAPSCDIAGRCVSLTWTRLDGEASLTIFPGSHLGYQSQIGGKTRLQQDALPFDMDLLQPFLDELDHFTKVKQVIVVRRDLKMRQGKAVSQGSHASGEFMREQILKHLQGDPIEITPDEEEWLTLGMAKITVRTDSPEQFEATAAAARLAGLKVRIITDAGHTEFHGVPTVTALAIGPTRSAYVDPVTKELTLL